MMVSSKTSKKMVALVLLALHFFSCKPIDKVTEGKIEGLVWFNDDAREMLRFRKDYVQQTRWDSTEAGVRKAEHYFPYTHDKELNTVTFNGRTIRLHETAEGPWQLVPETRSAAQEEGGLTMEQPSDGPSKEQEMAPLIQVMGTVVSSGLLPPGYTKVIFQASNDSTVIFETQTDARGHYQMKVPRNAYRIHAEAAGFISEGRQMDLTNLVEEGHADVTVTLSSWRLVAIEPQAIVRLGELTFDTNRAVIKPSSYPELNRLLQAMKEQPSLVIEIQGHTDNVGAAASNLKLSRQRAQAVKTFLVARGIRSERIRTIGYGETRPLVSNDDEEEGRALNRRVDVKIISL